MNTKKVTKELSIDDIEVARLVFGAGDTNLKTISRMLGVDIYSKGNKIVISGEEDKVDVAKKTIKKMREDISNGTLIYKKDIHESVIASEPEADDENVIITTYRGKKISPKTINQKKYVEAILKNDMVFAIGPAGTGKTYLSVVVGVKLLKENRVAKIVLSRPAVEAGERLGYLPGGILEKVDPYLRPLYDAIFDIYEYREALKAMDRGKIEVIPLAFMRGRTLSDAFIILDEAQNSTYEQMKMFLTRMGFDSKIVVTGDITQIDIQGRQSGLVEAEKILMNEKGIEFVNFTKEDVVRHPLVSRVIQAFEKYEREKK